MDKFTLKKTLKDEQMRYIPHIRSAKNIAMAIFTHNEEYAIYRFIRATRIAEYYQGKNKVMYTIYLRKSSIWGERLGFFIAPGVLGAGARIYHRSGVIINSQSIIGENCIFHGDNCVGNNGKDNLCPKLGRGVELGIGAKVIGNVTLADGIRVGANAVVTKSFLEPNITVAGIPAVKIK